MRTGVCDSEFKILVLKDIDPPLAIVSRCSFVCLTNLGYFRWWYTKAHMGTGRRVLVSLGNSLPNQAWLHSLLLHCLGLIRTSMDYYGNFVWTVCEEDRVPVLVFSHKCKSSHTMWDCEQRSQRVLDPHFTLILFLRVWSETCTSRCLFIL